MGTERVYSQTEWREYVWPMAVALWARHGTALSLSDAVAAAANAYDGCAKEGYLSFGPHNQPGELVVRLDGARPEVFRRK